MDLENLRISASGGSGLCPICHNDRSLYGCSTSWMIEPNQLHDAGRKKLVGLHIFCYGFDRLSDARGAVTKYHDRHPNQVEFYGQGR